jgi:hypothetical protein
MSDKIFHKPFEIKDSGERKTFSTGMQKDSEFKELRPDLIWVPGLVRLAELYGRGTQKYPARNWEKAETEEELAQFRESAFRHFLKWFRGDNDEDHLSAFIFHAFGAEMVKNKLAETIPEPFCRDEHLGEDIPF